MIGLVATLLFAGALVLSAGIILATIAPQWPRIVRLATGHVEGPSDRWRAMHVAADRRPFHPIRAATPRRGLLGRRAR